MAMEVRADAEDEVEIAELHGHLGYLMRRAQLWIFADFTRTLAEIPLTPAEFSVLLTIGANPALPQTAIADTLGIERAGLVRLLDRLEQAGWVQRRAAKRDRRSHALHLTEGGTETLERARLLADRHESHVIRRFGPARHADLLRLLADFSPPTDPTPPA